MILAHEYAHQLQFYYGLPSEPESTARPNELEADGMAGYLRRGYGKTTFAQIATAYNFAYAIGDNQTTSPGHHGTPAQRKSAVRLGFLLADPANSKLSATQLIIISSTIMGMCWQELTAQQNRQISLKRVTSSLCCILKS